MAVAHPDDALAAFGDGRVVGGDDQGGAVLGVEGEQQLNDLGPGGRVEVSCGLVGQEQAWSQDEGAGDRDALLLAAGQLGGQGAGPVGEPDGVQKQLGAGGRVEGQPPSSGQGGGDDVVAGRQRGKQVEPLEHEPDGGAVGGQPPGAEAGDGGAAHLDGAAVGRVDRAE